MSDRERDSKQEECLMGSEQIRDHDMRIVFSTLLLLAVHSLSQEKRSRRRKSTVEMFEGICVCWEIDVALSLLTWIVATKQKKRRLEDLSGV